MRKSILTSLSEDRKKYIVSMYDSGHTIKEISKRTGHGHVQISKILIHNGIIIKSLSDYNWIPTPTQVAEIIQMYVNDRRGIQFIADKFETYWDNINQVLLDNKIPKWTQSELTIANSNFYGPSKGFSGKQHSAITKKKMSKSQLNNCNRTSTTGPKSRYIETTIGKVQGSYEVAYLQKCFEGDVPLPIIGKAVHTPYGSYIPDFDAGGSFVEVKSPFTWEVCQGLRENQKGVKTNIQHKKIKWVDKNVKPVIVVVIDESEASLLFRRAIVNTQIIAEDIVYKNGKYYKQTPLLGSGL